MCPTRVWSIDGVPMELISLAQRIGFETGVLESASPIPVPWSLDLFKSGPFESDVLESEVALELGPPRILFEAGVSPWTSHSGLRGPRQRRCMSKGTETRTSDRHQKCLRDGSVCNLI